MTSIFLFISKISVKYNFYANVISSLRMFSTSLKHWCHLVMHSIPMELVIQWLCVYATVCSSWLWPLSAWKSMIKGRKQSWLPIEYIFRTQWVEINVIRNTSWHGRICEYLIYIAFRIRPTYMIKVQVFLFDLLELICEHMCRRKTILNTARILRNLTNSDLNSIV